jgi:hypothetical protein
MSIDSELNSKEAENRIISKVENTHGYDTLKELNIHYFDNNFWRQSQHVVIDELDFS